MGEVHKHAFTGNCIIVLCSVITLKKPITKIVLYNLNFRLKNSATN